MYLDYMYIMYVLFISPRSRRAVPVKPDFESALDLGVSPSFFFHVSISKLLDKTQNWMAKQIGHTIFFQPFDVSI